ncbi:hypothetical protein CTEN210_12168 [Chaetoceros tenuissimus]|uniref:Uncharacterized protein n=1 Tax=Chaetoceros tenuissimus TaxID=426638 RepID=A0AAD3D0P1_9STRA|nr:hypothetical protein CTEN210_12168 [Chaetoceros tenuissimus]
MYESSSFNRKGSPWRKGNAKKVFLLVVCFLYLCTSAYSILVGGYLFTSIQAKTATTQTPSAVTAAVSPITERIIPTPLDKEEFNPEDYYPEDIEESFLIPKKLGPGELMPIRWRDDLTPIDGEKCETFVVGLPDQLRHEMKAYMDANGLLDYAKTMLYDAPVPKEGNRIYTLNDGMKWASQVNGVWNTDMVWFDPADESAFESLISMLKKGGFGVVIESMGKAFDLNGIMIQGIGAIFLSKYEDPNRGTHVDMEGMGGKFFNVLFPVHIPEDDVARLYFADADNQERADEMGAVNVRDGTALIIGGDSSHKTVECDYRDKREFRLFLNVYIVDAEEETTVERISQESTSLWPTYGDKEYTLSQKERFYSKKDGRISMYTDQGRKPLHVADKDEKCSKMIHLCDADPDWRLNCPKTCEIYLEDDIYLEKIGIYNRDFSSSSFSLWQICWMIFTISVLIVFIRTLLSLFMTNSKNHSNENLHLA